MSDDKWSKAREQAARAADKAGKWAASEAREWNERRPQRKAAREQKQAAKVEEQRTKAEKKALKGMVRRTCKQCGHEWVVPKKLIKATKQAGAAAILGSPVAAVAYGSKGVDMSTCASCGSVGFFTQTEA